MPRIQEWLPGRHPSTNPRPICWWVALALSLITAGCNMPGFEPSVEPLVIPESPPKPEFGQVEPEAPPPELGLESQPPPVLEPVESEPQLATLCTSTLMYVRSSPGKPVAGVEPDNTLALLDPGTQVTWTGNSTQAMADGQLLTWYEIDTESGLHGWSASDFLSPGGCGPTAVVGGFPTIVESPWYSGTPWLGETANCEGCTHYGVDIGPGAGDSHVYSPWAGEILAYDNCDGCPEGDGNTYNSDNATDEVNNWGYGASVVVEHSYADMSGADIQRLRDSGIDIQPGESLYMMYTHLDRQVENPQVGTALAAGDAVAVMDSSGNSQGLHAHVEAAVAASGLSESAGDTMLDFWWNRVVGVDWRAETIEGKQGRRFDPGALFNLP